MERFGAENESGEAPAVLGRADVPALPKIPNGTMWRDPYVIVSTGLQHSLGWQDARKYGPIFVLIRFGAMSSRKVIDRFPLTEEGWTSAWAALLKLDTTAAEAIRDNLGERAARGAEHQAKIERQTRLYELFEDASQVRAFPALGVKIFTGDNDVYSIGVHIAATKVDTSQLLGPLAGAEAVVTGGSQAWSPGRAAFMPIGLAPLATKAKAHAAVVFSDGTVHAKELDGNNAVREAQLQVVQFNALAAVPEPVPSEADNDPSDPATKLRALQDLLAAGLITQEEYAAKRAEVIKSI